MDERDPHPLRLTVHVPTLPLRGRRPDRWRQPGRAGGDPCSRGTARDRGIGRRHRPEEHQKPAYRGDRPRILHRAVGAARRPFHRRLSPDIGDARRGGRTLAPRNPAALRAGTRLVRRRNRDDRRQQCRCHETRRADRSGRADSVRRRTEAYRAGARATAAGGPRRARPRGGCRRHRARRPPTRRHVRLARPAGASSDSTRATSSPPRSSSTATTTTASGERSARRRTTRCGRCCQAASAIRCRPIWSGMASPSPRRPSPKSR